MTACRSPQMSQTPTTPLPNSGSGRSRSRSSSRMARRPVTSRGRFLTLRAGAARRRPPPPFGGVPRQLQLEARPVAGSEDRDADGPQPAGERAVRGDHRGPAPDRCLLDRAVPPADGGHEPQTSGERPRGTREGSAAGDERIELRPNGPGDGELGARKEPVDLLGERETFAERQERRVRVEQDEAAPPRRGPPATGRGRRCRAAPGRTPCPPCAAGGGSAATSGSPSWGSPRRTRGTSGP